MWMLISNDVCLENKERKIKEILHYFDFALSCSLRM
ncbi:MAG: hypothetical protein SCARUB_04440 [Candidatus Scalindua rubra]|uniref:Uncharacterized protein n=1 Tax=Candidatus Scalindua rubra TaxID=1872076 RepID=A0A1E3X4I6_9BACT|nr:MAG: hypothetical protein SCARUB_04440 [Candidatus Scalindua rubra]